LPEIYETVDRKHEEIKSRIGANISARESASFVEGEEGDSEDDNAEE
jgi:hypothetical protein